MSDTDVPVGWAYNQSHLYVVKKTRYDKTKHQIVIDGELKTATLNGAVKEATIILLDGSNGQQVHAISGVLPNRPQYGFIQEAVNTALFWNTSQLSGFKSGPHGRGFFISLRK